MNYIEKIKDLISNGEIKEASTNMLEDAINAVLGDPVSIGKIIIALAKSPFFIREQLFWTKMEAFLNGIYLSEDGNGEQKYSFTTIAIIVDQYAASYENVERYPNPKVLKADQASPTVSISALEWESF